MSVARHGPFVINCSSAVTLVFLNRRLLASCAFRYVGLLAALHMGVTALIALVQAPLSAQKTALQPQEVLFFMCFTVVSMVSMNLSLMLNHVGVYQISKIAMIPTCCALEYVLMGKLLTRARAAAVVVVCAGVFIATVSDVSSSWGGFTAALVGVLSSSSHNVLCSSLTKKYDISGATLVRDTAPMQALALLLVGPFVDKLLVRTFPWEWQLGPGVIMGQCYSFILLTCGLAAVVNISLVSCIKTYSATGSQVLGHAKTVLILVICWLEHESNPNIVLWRQYVGAAVAMTGLLAYNWASAPAQGAVAAAKPAAVTSAPPAAEEEVAAQVLDGGDTELCEVHSRGKSAHAGNET